MFRDMVRLRAWLRPPLNLLLIFFLIVCVPAAALAGLGLRLLEQDRALARQRQIDLPDRAANQAVRVLDQALTMQRKQIESSSCDVVNTPEDNVCVVFRPGRIEAMPSNGVPYFPRAQSSQEVPSEHFEEVEFFEYMVRNFSTALELSRNLATVADPAIRAGALLRQGRILRKMGRHDEALVVFNRLSQISTVTVEGEPTDLIGRRVRCAILEERSRKDELQLEAESLAADLRGGKWQLDRATFLLCCGASRRMARPANRRRR